MKTPQSSSKSCYDQESLPPSLSCLSSARKSVTIAAAFIFILCLPCCDKSVDGPEPAEYIDVIGTYTRSQSTGSRSMEQNTDDPVYMYIVTDPEPRSRTRADILPMKEVSPGYFETTGSISHVIISEGGYSYVTHQSHVDDSGQKADGMGVTNKFEIIKIEGGWVFWKLRK